MKGAEFRHHYFYKTHSGVILSVKGGNEWKWD